MNIPVSARLSFGIAHDDVPLESLTLAQALERIRYQNAVIERQAATIETQADVLEKEKAEREKLQDQVTETRMNAVVCDLTGLLTRKQFREDVTDLIRRNENGEAANFSIYIFDLDKFKGINDNLGHDAGDEVLKVFSVKAENSFGTPRSAIRKDATEDANWLKDGRMPFQVFRTGGDEFCLIVRDEDEAAIKEKTESLNGSVTFIHEDEKTGEAFHIEVHFTNGRCAYTGQKNVDQMLKEADIDLYKNKDIPGRLPSAWRDVTPAKPGTAPPFTGPVIL